MKDELKEIFSGRRITAEILKGLLESSGIISMIKDDSLGTVTSPYANLGGNVKLLVNCEDEELAKTLLQEQGDLQDDSQDDSQED